MLDYYMQRLSISFFIVFFAGLSLFGIVFMAHQGSMTHGECLAGGVSNAACPQDIGALPMIDLHFSALGLFSSAIFSEFPAFGDFILLGIALAILLDFGAGILSHSIAVVMRHRSSFDLIYSAFHRQMSGWLALLSRKDPSLDRVFNF